MTEPAAFEAIWRNDLYALTAALDTGTDLNASDGCGFTLLMDAVRRNRLHIVNVLLSRGANVHLKDRHGRTALHFATREWCRDVFPVVFSAAGSSAMNIPDCYGSTPLYLLARNGSAEQMAFALSHPGIYTSIRNCFEHASLDWADHRTALKMYGD
jgi:ankyrin repeat protein